MLGRSGGVAPGSSELAWVRACALRVITRDMVQSIWCFCSVFILLQAVRIPMVLVMRTVTDIQNGVRLVGTIGSEEGNRGGDPSQC